MVKFRMQNSGIDTTLRHCRSCKLKILHKRDSERNMKKISLVATDPLSDTQVCLQSPDRALQTPYHCILVTDRDEWKRPKEHLERPVLLDLFDCFEYPFFVGYNVG